MKDVSTFPLDKTYRKTNEEYHVDVINEFDKLLMFETASLF